MVFTQEGSYVPKYNINKNILTLILILCGCAYQRSIAAPTKEGRVAELDKGVVQILYGEARVRRCTQQGIGRLQTVLAGMRCSVDLGSASRGSELTGPAHKHKKT